MPGSLRNEASLRLDRAMAARSPQAAFARILRSADHLPEIEESTSYGTPALKVRGKLIARLKDAETLVIMCPSRRRTC